MCGRYFIAEKEDDETFTSILRTASEKNGGSIPTGEIAPTMTVPVLANNKKLQPEPFMIRWGYHLSDGHLVINARSESAGQKLMFRDSMLRRRCVMPASYYFEWNRREKSHTRYGIRACSGAPLYLAGLYRIREGRAEFVVLTRTPAENLAAIHDRMPVILPRDRIADWLDPRVSASEILPLALTQMEYKAM